MNGIRLKTYVLVSSFFLSASFGAMAKKDINSVSSVDVEAVTSSISRALQDDYIFPDVAKKITEVLARNTESGVYDKYQTPEELSVRLTDDVRSINNDVHLNVNYTPQNGGMRMVMRGGPGGAVNPDMLKRLARDNFGFKSLEILEGNIGYLNVSSMVSPTYAGETAAAAMQYLQNTDAIIFDMRENRGGAGEMYQLLASYLFEAGPVLLNEIYWPSEERRYQTWTLPHLPGKRMPNKDIYILTSSNTGSAAEVFSYTLKHHGRATIVGEVTVGAANPVSPTKVSNNFTVWMSKGQSKHPVTQSNWEGKGVVPHVKTIRSEALHTAHLSALTKLSESKKDDSGYFSWYKEIVKAKSGFLKIDEKILRSYEGTFVGSSGDTRVIKLDNGHLWYGPNNQKLTRLIPLSNTRFMIPGDNSFKLEVNLERGTVKGINRLFSSGRIINMTKNKAV